MLNAAVPPCETNHSDRIRSSVFLPPVGVGKTALGGNSASALGPAGVQMPYSVLILQRGSAFSKRS